MIRPRLLSRYGWALCILFSVYAEAQIEFEVLKALNDAALPAATSAATSAAPKMARSSFWVPVTAGVSVGTDGLGISLIRPVTPRFAVRAGFNYADVSIRNWSPNLSRFGIKLNKVAFDISLAQTAVSLIGEWKLWKKRNIRALAGIEYAFQNQYIIKAGYKDTFSVSTISLSPDEIGTIQYTITHGAKLSPFIGLGFGRTVPKKRYGFTVDFGAYYKGKPVAAIEGTGLLDDNADNAARLNSNKAFQSYRWYPVGTVRFVYRIFADRAR